MRQRLPERPVAGARDRRNQEDGDGAPALIARAAFALGLACASPLAAASSSQPIAPDVWLVPGSFAPGHQPDGNSVIFQGSDGVVLVDTGRHADHVAAIEQALTGRRGRLVAIVNTHWHLDHVSGNLALKAAHPGVRVYASDAIDGALTGFLADSAKSARAYLATQKLGPDQRTEIEGDLATFDRGAELKPDVVIARSEELRLAGRRLRIELARSAATAGDIWLYDPATRVVVAGDLVTLPAPFLDTACPEGWKRALDSVAATPFATLVPGHGTPMTRPGFEAYRSAFAGFIDCAAGKDLPETCADGWVAATAGLTAPAEAPAGRRMAIYYVGLLRGGSATRYCVA